MRGRIDFQDDGGTPMRRRRQAEIYAARRRRLTFGQAAALIVFVGFVLPYLIIFGGLLLVGLVDVITR